MAGIIAPIESGMTRRIRRRSDGHWCATTAEARDPARLCPTPPDNATQSFDEDGGTDEESSEEVMCAGSSRNVHSMVQATNTMSSGEWDGSPQNTASESVS